LLGGEVIVEDLEKIKTIKETGICDLMCSDCKIETICKTMLDVSKKEVAATYLNK
jgi:hypothetical protein